MAGPGGRGHDGLRGHDDLFGVGAVRPGGHDEGDDPLPHAQPAVGAGAELVDHA